VGFRRAISLEGDARFNSSEAWILASAVGLLMAALISMDATSRAAQKRCDLGNYPWRQYCLAALVVGPGWFGPLLDRSAFVPFCS